MLNIQGVIDRIEESQAVVLLTGGGEMLLPSSMLPPGAGEGSVLILTAEIDRQAEEYRRGKVSDLQRKLKNK